jgi:hypothetical protein
MEFKSGKGIGAWNLRLKRRLKMKKILGTILLMALVVFVGANLVLAGTSNKAFLGISSPIGASYEVPIKEEIRAQKASDSIASLGMDNPNKDSYEVPIKEDPQALLYWR